MQQSEEFESEEEYDCRRARDERGQRTSTETQDGSRTGSVGSDFDGSDFGSTASLASSVSGGGSYPNGNREKLTNVRMSRLDPQQYRKHRERNISLRANLSEKLLKPVIASSIKKMDRLSQNISNYQVNMQDSLFQSRTSTSNLLKLEKQLEKFVAANYLNEIKTHEDHSCRSFVEMDDDSSGLDSYAPTVPL